VKAQRDCPTPIPPHHPTRRECANTSQTKDERKKPESPLSKSGQKNMSTIVKKNIQPMVNVKEKVPKKPN
jgi:hypothetical protein